MSIDELRRSPNTKTPKIRRKTIREYLKGIITERSPIRSDVISNRYPKEPRVIMPATTVQSIPGVKNLSPLKNTHAVVNGKAAIIVKVAMLADGMSGGVNLVTRSLMENANSAATAHKTA